MGFLQFMGQTLFLQKNRQNIDADQDGIVYYLLPADWDGNYAMEPVDGAKYRTWRESFLEGASKLDDIWFRDLKEENIAILGAEKPD